MGNVGAFTCVPSQIYPLIYQFLTDNDLTKTAKCFKKETKVQPVQNSGLGLVEICAKHFAIEQSKSDENEESKIDSTKTEGAYSAVPLVYEGGDLEVTKEKKSKKKRKLDEGKKEQSEGIFSLIPKSKKKKKDEGENGNTPVVEALKDDSAVANDSINV